jgi:acid stress chaperone HdeA
MFPEFLQQHGGWGWSWGSVVPMSKSCCFPVMQQRSTILLTGPAQLGSVASTVADRWARSLLCQLGEFWQESRPQNERRNEVKQATAKLTAIVLGAVLVAGVAGCSASNNGGSTTCKQYSSLNSDERKDTIKKMLNDRGEDPSNGKISLTKASIIAYCATAGSDDSTIDGIYGG